MNSIHDMGGMHGFGPIPKEENEPVFHAEWEGRTVAMRIAMNAWQKWNIDMARQTVERFSPAQYLSMSYYERWITSLGDMLVEADLVSLAEIESGKVRSKDKQTPPLTAEVVPVMFANGRPSARETDTPPRFLVNDTVLTNRENPSGHTRLPRYARGRMGHIVLHHGAHVFPDSSAHGGGDAPQHLYAVRFSAAELWGASGGARDTVTLDLWESYLTHG
ncbi:MAG: nitrile hydratase subunit beta [Pseudomonadota bacterium]|nr:nitrile hydratase subunit beta [Pseudomonadota bacterium]